MFTLGKNIKNYKTDFIISNLIFEKYGKRNWDYVFFLDLDGHAEEPAIKLALEEVNKNCSLFRILGSYPKAMT